jgi:alcohol dehydrogenase class IV
MDAAKAMWVCYEHPQISELSDILPPKQIPKLRKKARMVCIPSTSGTASEVSRSVVITDEKTKIKYGIGNMEMVPDIAICDPEVTASLPPKITAETGLDALTHAIEAYVSRRANYISDLFAIQAVKDIFEYLPKAYEEGTNLDYREKMLNASLIAGLAFTNVSLGIVHSMAHTLGSCFAVPHGLADAVILPYIIEYNSANTEAADRYKILENELGIKDFVIAVKELNKKLNIPSDFSGIITNKEKYYAKLGDMAVMALNDGCTKTNPIIPSINDLIELFKKVYYI